MSPTNTVPPAPAACRDCRHFSNEPLRIEAAFPGLSAMGSGFGAVRNGDGLCERHGRYLSGGGYCLSFAPRSASSARSTPRWQRASSPQ
jgi:hypothetical protein